MEFKIVNILGIKMRFPLDFYKDSFMKKWKKQEDKWVTKKENPIIYFKDYKNGLNYSYQLGNYPVSKPFDIDKIYNIDNINVNRLICESYNYSEENILDIRYGIIRNFNYEEKAEK